ncbi:MAG: hypothetical protein AAGH65_04145 [Pseudomonadota bacterium]
MKISLFVLALGVLLAVPAALANEPIGLVQDRNAVLEDQRLVGNSRAQAKGRGTIRTVPQLYVYHADTRAAYHLEGYREGFITYLDRAVRSYREDRSVVDLDKLLERAHRPIDADTTPSPSDYLTLDDLAARDLTIVLYFSEHCEACDSVQEDLNRWLDEHPQYTFNNLRVRVN